MKQADAVKQAIEKLGGLATLAQIYPEALSIKSCNWGTKTPYASIRRIVRHTPGIYVVRKGLYALESHRGELEKDGYVEITKKNADSQETMEFSHSYYQGLLAKVGEFRNFDTFVPQQDKNKKFFREQLKDIRTLQEIPSYSYDYLVNRSSSIDVIWFNKRTIPDGSVIRMPHSFFEVEHSTDIQNSLLKFCDLQCFSSRMMIVADEIRRPEFMKKISAAAFDSLRENQRVSFLPYDTLVEQYEAMVKYYYMPVQL